MNFLEMKTQLRDEIWFSDEQENLIAAHNNFFQQAMYDLQRAVPCYRSNNKDVYPHCASYFECGLTVVPAPRGEIVEVFTIDKINPTTGLEDATVADDWCAKVFYNPVRYCELERFRCLCERVPTTSILSVADSLAALWWGVYRIKHAYPRPTDEGFGELPVLTEGRHYPQASTNAGGRSPGGRFAINGGRLYIGPWIESTESLVIKWNGIKRKWSDSDFVDDDPKVLQAIRLNVQIQHFIAYEDNPGKLAELKAQYGNPDLGQWGALQDLIDECRRENEAVRCREVGGGTSAARGFGPGNEFPYSNNVRVERTATCPVGQTGTAKTVVKEIGSVGGNSVEDANSRAATEALSEATAALVCVTPAVTYSSVALVGHASCGSTAEGSDVNVPVPAGFRTSSVSQAAADALAQAAADALAAAQLVCTFWNAEQTATYSCPSGQTQTGANGTATVPAHTPPFSGPSQSFADQLAYNEAVRLATLDFTDNGGLCEAAPPPLFYSQAQQAGPFQKSCTIVGHSNNPGTEATTGPATPCSFTVTVLVNIHAGAASGSSQIAANEAALATASNYALAVMNQVNFCNGFTCAGGTRIFNI